MIILDCLYARIGMPYSPATGKPITKQTSSEIVKKIKNIQKIKKYLSYLL